MVSLFRRRYMGAAGGPAPVVPKYFALIAKPGGGRVVFSMTGSTTSTWNPKLEYSVDGENWTEMIIGTRINVPSILYVRGDNPGGFSNSSSRYITLTLTDIVSVKGDIRSLYDKTMTATSMVRFCFTNLFRGSAIEDASELILPDFVSERCYQNMFLSCTALTEAPALPAPDLSGGSYCYSNMFSGCTALQVAPDLPAQLLGASCYQSMFTDCSALIQAPALPAYNMVNYCYRYMFQRCTALEIAPELPCQYPSLATQPYGQMFQDCSSLRYIKALFLDDPEQSSFSRNWVSGVAAAGVFVMDAAATWTLRGANGIPDNWTVQTVNP